MSWSSLDHSTWQATETRFMQQKNQSNLLLSLHWYVLKWAREESDSVIIPSLIHSFNQYAFLEHAQYSEHVQFSLDILCY